MFRRDALVARDIRVVFCCIMIVVSNSLCVSAHTIVPTMD